MLLGWSAFFLTIWLSIPAILATDRCLDLTDEGYYLLAASQESTTDQSRPPPGWHTGVIFRLVNFDISKFRQFGAFLFLAASGLLGFKIVKTLADSSDYSNQDKIILSTVGLLIGNLGALLFYASLLVTPSYNWSNLLGLTVGAIGYLPLIADCGKNKKLLWPSVWGNCFVAAIGLFITVPAKPSSAPIMFIVGSIMIFLNQSKTKWLKVNSIILLFFGLLVLLASISGLWPWPFWEKLKWFFDGPSLVPEHSGVGALKSILLTPAKFREELGNLNKIEIFLITFSSVTFLISQMIDDPWLKKSSALFVLGFGALCIVCLTIAHAFFGFINPSTTVERFCFAPIVTALLTLNLLFFMVILVSTAPKIFKNQNNSFFFSSKKVKISCFIFLIVVPFIFGFGSGNSPYRMAGLASNFFLLSLIILILCIKNIKTQLSTSFILILFAGILCTTTILDSHAFPYRQKNVKMQTALLSVGKQQSLLFIEPELAQELSKFKSEAINQGWTPGKPILGVVWRWASTVPFLLEAKVPDCIVLTIFGYQNSVKLAKYNITKKLKNFPTHDSWILTSNPEALNEKEKQEVASVLKYLENTTKNKFPEKYIKVAKTNKIELWKPIN